MPGVILIMKLMVIVKLENIQPPWFICVTKCSFIGRYIEKINIKFFQKAQKIACWSVNICIIYFELYFWYWSWFSIRHFKTFTLYEWLSLLLKLYFSMIFTVTQVWLFTSLLMLSIMLFYVEYDPTSLHFLTFCWLCAADQFENRNMITMNLICCRCRTIQTRSQDKSVQSRCLNI